MLARLASDLLASLDSDIVDAGEIDRSWSTETQRRAAMLEIRRRRHRLVGRGPAALRGASHPPPHVSLRVEFHDLAHFDLFEAWTWYEDHQDGLGDRFLDAIEATVHRAALWPHGDEPVLRDDGGEIIEGKVPADGFPYAVRYGITGDHLVVMAVLHQHRHPNLGTDVNHDCDR